jgi:hypothetical protein
MHGHMNVKLVQRFPICCDVLPAKHDREVHISSHCSLREDQDKTVHIDLTTCNMDLLNCLYVAFSTL